ncbi:MAG: hypothetical protein WBG17_05245 [Burkholderiaceae bacterium]
MNNPVPASSLALQKLADRIVPPAPRALPDEDRDSPVLRVFNALRNAGYTIGTPIRAYPPRARYHADWHVRISRPEFEFTLSFLVPEDVS